MVIPELEAPATTEKVEFLYDGQGRRLAKTVTRRDAPGSPVATFYVWDGWTVVEETESVRDAETGLWTETVVAEYLPGLGLDDHIVAFLHGEEVHFHQDHLGSVLMLTDADGAVLQRYRYDIHGNATVLDANGQPATGHQLVPDGPLATGHQPPISPYLFTGRRLDRETGLYYYRNRYYSPLLGKFISPDPLDYVDGMNVYAYVNGNVVNLVDPMGTRERYPDPNEDPLRYVRRVLDEKVEEAGLGGVSGWGNEQTHAEAEEKRHRAMASAAPEMADYHNGQAAQVQGRITGFDAAAKATEEANRKRYEEQVLWANMPTPELSRGWRVFRTVSVRGGSALLIVATLPVSGPALAAGASLNTVTVIAVLGVAEAGSEVGTMCYEIYADEEVSGVASSTLQLAGVRQDTADKVQIGINVTLVVVNVGLSARAASEAAEELAKAQARNVDDYVRGLPSRRTPTGTAANQFEIRHTGDMNYRVSGGGEVFDIDGYRGTTILETKFVGTPSRSPFVPGSDAPDFIRQGILEQVDDELRRMRAIIDDTSNPFRSVEVITNDPQAADLFRQMMKSRGLQPNARLGN